MTTPGGAMQASGFLTKYATNSIFSVRAPFELERLIEIRNSKFENPSLGCFDGQHLAPAIVSTGGTGGVSRDSAAALAAFAQLAGVPAVCRLARAQAHLRGFAFWGTHGLLGLKF